MQDLEQETEAIERNAARIRKLQKDWREGKLSAPEDPIEPSDDPAIH